MAYTMDMANERHKWLMLYAAVALLAFASQTLAANPPDADQKGPVFLKEPTNRIDFSNSTGAEIECKASGNPMPEIIWIRSDGTAVGDVPGLRQISSDGKLVFPPFRAEDYRQEVHAQVYACLARNQFGSIISRDVHVRAVVQQFYESEVNNEYVIRGNAAVLKCSIPSFVADFVQVVSWQDEEGKLYGTLGEQQGAADGKYLVLPSGELHIREVGPEDGYKSYQCRTKHRLTGETRLSATKGRLVITEPVGSVSPQLSGNGNQEHITLLRAPMKGSVTLMCPAQAYPVPFFRWYKFIEGTTRKQAVVLNDRVKQVSGTLIIKDAVVEDSGKYLCVVNNSVGGESVETVLTVTAPLSAKIDPPTQTVDFGRPAVFTCQYTGNPIKTVSWMKDGKAMGHSEPVLRIESVKKEDKGMYQCFVRNDQESAEASAELKLGGRFDPPVIRQAFQEETMEPGPSVFLKCVAGGNPTPEISWELDGKKIANNDRYQVGQYVTVNGDVVSYLNITSVHANDGGLYKCIAKSKVGEAEHSAKLNVYGLPYIRQMEKKAIVAGETLIVTCPVAGYPIDSIVWERDNRALPINRKQKVFPNGTLIIENVERNSDQATYTCVAKNQEGYSARGSLEVQVMALPQIVPFAFEDVINTGDSIDLFCQIQKGDRPIKVSWSFERSPSPSDGSYEGQLPQMRTNRISSKTSMLSIPSASPAHTGRYTCLASNAAGTTSYGVDLTVNVPPRWILEPTDKAFAQGSDAKVECKADGFPKPQVTWKKAVGDTPGEYKDLKKSDNIRVEEGTLHVDNIQKTNEGYYLCEAINGIGSGLSAVIMISVQAPPEFTEKLRNQTARRGEPAVLQCEAKGEKPIGILWNMNNMRLDPKNDNRYTIREEILSTGVMSSLSIKRTERSDSALFTCVATNAFGSDDASINMIVQEVPEMPYALKVLDKSGRSVQLSWAQPYDGNSPLNRYIIEFKRSRASWSEIDRVMVPGHTTEAQVQKLSPATTYNIRIVAENVIGTSQSSEAVTIITAEEAPSGKPQNIKVEPVNQTTMRVTWKPPPRTEWNGEILGYYVGYKLSNTNSSYVFETINFITEEGKEHNLELQNLRVYTQYSVVIQAFNKIGAGPLSEEEKQFTAEGTPSQPPSDTSCTTLTSQTIRVSWVSPPLESANGVIKTYKVVYAPSDEWYDETKRHYKKTASSDTVLHGLKKYTNYTMQVLATTAGGDGVRSAPIHCQTEPDVPEAPTDVKALVMGNAAILVSWRQPAQPNGIITQYTVYSKAEGAETETKTQKVPHYQMSFEASELEKNKPYEFWVTASTTIGEGQQSKSIVAMPSDQVPAKIASFDDTFTATFKEDAKMPCLAVGAPQPEITWKIKGVDFSANDRMRLLPDGSLLIKSVNRQDAGDYSCHAENSIAKDSITHKLIVLAPPQSPHVTLSATTTDALTVKLKPHEGDTAPLHGYTLHYKPEFGEWETAEVSVDSQKQNIENLLCGSRYQVYATGFNNIGAGEASDILNTRTKGQKPKLPEKPRFIEVSSNSVSLHFKAWKDGGCPMSHFVVESKKRDQIEWNQISNNVKPDNNYVVLDLEPATWYNLRITAHNSAGFTVAEYDFATLTVTGGTIAPLDDGLGHGNVHTRIRLPAWMPEWLDLNFMVPLIATVVVVAVGICVVCVALSRRRADDLRGGQKDVYYDVVYNQTMGPGATLDKRRPDLRDELGYIAPPNRKLPPVPGSNYNTCDRIKRGMEDEICPYATFHLLGFREEMDPTKAMNFQTFPHQNGHTGPVPGHAGTMLPPGHPGHVHSRSGSQSMPRANRYQRKNSQGGQSSIYTPAPEYDDPANCAEEDQYRRYTRVNSQGGSLYSGPGPEYDDPANCAPEEDQYGSQYGGPYGQPYDHYGSRGSMGRRSVGSARNPGNGSPEPPPPPPRNHDMSNSSFNDSKESNEISEAECDRDHGPRGNYGEDSNEAVKRSPQPKDQRTTEEMRKLIESRRLLNEAGPKQLQLQQQANGAGFTAYDTMAV
ncbi:Down syndrome cell adhesion molecule-like protein Dscam2 isoform X48 [Drosophila subobscura]|uniref:Down syndrome cell adhesion molecule-like protein Dscam2 isoform X48 n=1 Tax=Drosophila subobscura TaxID=7241 RepID=UPI00155AC385|nr:Down syndrome cell adhesion molecule-like protein Dscam2 isoform X48 [Drosophila subobscura]